MRARLYIPGLIVVLLALGVSRVSTCPPRSDGALSPEHTQSSSDPSRALFDLDGDGLADPVMLEQAGFRHTIELHLSRTDERVVLPVMATAGGDRSLSAQDLDGDGDTDLLWQGSPPSHAVVIWLNDGRGRFECLCLPESRERGVALDGPGVSAAHRHRPACVLSPERTPGPGYARTPRWDFHVVTIRGSHRPEPVWPVSYRTRLLSPRSPPLLCC